MSCADIVLPPAAPAANSPPRAGAGSNVRVFAACRYALIFLVPALLLVYLKSHIMEEGLWTAGRALGREQLHQFPQFSWSEYLTFYRGDLLSGFVVIPLLGGLLAWLLPRRLRAPAILLVSTALVAALVMEYRAYRMMGRFPSREILADAVRFWTVSTGIADTYLKWSLGFVLKLALLAGGLGVLAWWAWRRDSQQAVPGRRTRIACGCLAGGVLAVTGWAWLPWMDAGALHRGVLTQMWIAYWGEESVGGTKLDTLSPAELVARYRAMTGAPAPRPVDRREYWGKAKDQDVIVFVLETLPAACLRMDGDLKGCPTMRRLRERSLVPLRHYSNYPFTTRAVFSLVTSWHPSSFSSNFPERFPGKEFPGLMSGLGKRGYATAVYLTNGFTFQTEEPVYTAVGIEKRYYSDAHAAAVTASDPVRKRIEYDRLLMEELKRDMTKWHKEDRRFAVLFQPQVGHGPFPDLSGKRPDDPVLARRRSVTGLEDLWLAEIVNHLEKAGRLDKTLIVVLGDHGVRSRLEDPDFPVGMIEEYSFHVPFLLYAPAAFPKRRDVPWMTSHIDLTPSLLDLLGVAEGREFEQGSPLWDERLAGRTNFFWGNHYFGSDGYYRPGKPFAMWHHFRDAVYQNDRLDFDPRAGYGPGTPEYEEATRRLREMINLQEAWGLLARRPAAAPAPKVAHGWSRRAPVRPAGK